MITSFVVGCICGAIVGLFVGCICVTAAENDPYPCRYCEKETCSDCEYWNNMTGGNNDATS